MTYFGPPNSGDLERAPYKMDPNSFITLLKLTKEQTWLEPLSTELIALWNTCNTVSEQNLVCDLLRRFIFVNSNEYREFTAAICQQIVSVWGEVPHNTIFVASANNHETDGSLPLVHSIKSYFSRYPGWHERNFYTRLGEGCGNVVEGNTIILIDDFIGTGSKISKVVTWINNRLRERGISNYKIKICAIGAMEQSRQIITSIAADNFCANWIKRGISDHYQGDELQAAISDMLNLENALETPYNGRKMPSLGYQSSEALFYIEPYNVPNNVFPIFWWPSQKPGVLRHTIFRRF